MHQALVHEQRSADDRLAELGLTQVTLGTVLLQADAEAAQTTPLDPPTAEGMARYAATVRFLRMALMPHGWDYDNSGNFCCDRNQLRGWRHGRTIGQSLYEVRERRGDHTGSRQQPNHAGSRQRVRGVPGRRR